MISTVNWVTTLINLIFPPKCVFCRSLVDVSSPIAVCPACYQSLPFSTRNIMDTFPSGMYFDNVVCLLRYEEDVRKSIKRFKFYDKPSNFRPFAVMLSNKINKMTIQMDFDIILSIPLFSSRQSERGYNQSLLISTEIAKRLAISEKSYLLKRIRNTGSQSQLDRVQRKDNVKGAFKVTSENAVQGKHILLVDDILTTGSTVNECARVLKEAGARKVTVAIVASGRC